MNKFFSNFILVSSALIMSATIAFYLSYQTGDFNLSDKPAENTKRQVYTNEEGEPKYSQGSCQVDSDCVPAGCSSQVCSNDPELLTDCAIREDFPDKETYSCGCVENSCTWYTK